MATQARDSAGAADTLDTGDRLEDIIDAVILRVARHGEVLDASAKARTLLKLPPELQLAEGQNKGKRYIDERSQAKGRGTDQARFVCRDLAPSVLSLVPSSGARGASNLHVQIIGANFVSGAKVKFGNGVTVNSHTFINPTEIDVVISISATK